MVKLVKLGNHQLELTLKQVGFHLLTFLKDSLSTLKINLKVAHPQTLKNSKNIDAHKGVLHTNAWTGRGSLIVVNV